MQQGRNIEVCWLGGLMHWLVVDRDIEDDILALRMVRRRGIHPLQAGLHDVRHFVGKGWVIVDDPRVGGSQQWRVAIGVLQSLTGQGRATSGGPDQEAPRHLVGHRPDEVPDALKTKHRVEDEERDHRLTVRGVRRSGCRGRAKSAGFGDALMQHLAIHRLTPLEQQAPIDRLVLLTAWVVDLGAREHRVHPESAIFIRRNRHDPLADLLILHPVAQLPHQSHGAGHLRLSGAGLEVGVDLIAGHLELAALDLALGQGATQSPAAFEHVLDGVGVFARMEERRGLVGVEAVFDVAVTHRQAQPVAELEQ